MKLNKTIVVLCGLVPILACTGGGGAANLGGNFLIGFDPGLVAAGGSVVAVIDAEFNREVTAKMDGSIPVVVSGVNLDGRVKMVVPVGTSNGVHSFKVKDGSIEMATLAFTVGSPIDVVEVEPNDFSAGTNATNVGKNRMGHGTLSSIGDRDVFKFDGIALIKYKIMITAGSFESITINGQVVPVTNNVVSYAPTQKALVLQFAGATGDYAFTVEAAMD